MKTSLWTLGRCAEHFLYFFDSMILKMADIDTVFAVIPQTHVIKIYDGYFYRLSINIIV